MNIFTIAAGVEMRELPQVVGDGWRISVTKLGELRIRKSRPEDMRDYVCHAQNSIKPDISKIIQLQVLGM